MAHMILKVFLAVEFPLAVLLGGRWILSQVSGRAAAMHPLTAGKQARLRPLNLRWFGIGLEAAKRSWSWFIDVGRRAGEKLLAKDLLFSCVYGGVVTASLWWIWETLGHPFHPAWIVALPAIILTAVWTENLIQVAQLCSYVFPNEGLIQYLWIKVSCFATIIKLWLTLGLYVSLAGMVVRLMVMPSHRRLSGMPLTDAAMGFQKQRQVLQSHMIY